jgi:hypothetical protein
VATYANNVLPYAPIDLTTCPKHYLARRSLRPTSHSSTAPTNAEVWPGRSLRRAGERPEGFATNARGAHGNRWPADSGSSKTPTRPPGRAFDDGICRCCGENLTHLQQTLALKDSSEDLPQANESFFDGADDCRRVASAESSTPWRTTGRFRHERLLHARQPLARRLGVVEDSDPATRSGFRRRNPPLERRRLDTFATNSGPQGF